MLECPHCNTMIQKADNFADGLKGKARKSHKTKARKKYKGDFIYKHFGFSGSKSAPKNAMSVDICKSCGWTSVNRRDGVKYTNTDGFVTIAWRNMFCGLNINWKEIVRRNGW